MFPTRRQKEGYHPLCIFLVFLMVFLCILEEVQSRTIDNVMVLPNGQVLHNRVNVDPISGATFSQNGPIEGRSLTNSDLDQRERVKRGFWDYLFGSSKVTDGQTYVDGEKNVKIGRKKRASLDEDPSSKSESPQSLRLTKRRTDDCIERVANGGMAPLGYYIASSPSSDREMSSLHPNDSVKAMSSPTEMIVSDTAPLPGGDRVSSGAVSISGANSVAIGRMRRRRAVFRNWCEPNPSSDMNVSNLNGRLSVSNLPQDFNPGGVRG